MVAVLRLVVVVKGDLVLRARLPRDPPCPADDVAIVEARSVEIGLIRACRAPQEVPVAVGHRLLDPPVAECALPPQPVLEDWAADRWIEVPDLLDPADVRQAVSHFARRRVGGIEREIAVQVVAQVVDVPTFAREVSEHHATEGVAAILGHHVDPDAALCHFRRVRACDIADFLPASVVPVHAAVGAVGLQVVQAEAVNGLDRICRALVVQR